MLNDLARSVKTKSVTQLRKNYSRSCTACILDFPNTLDLILWKKEGCFLTEFNILSAGRRGASSLKE